MPAPTFPNLPDVHMVIPWHLTDGGSLDFYFDVPGDPITDTREAPAGATPRTAQNPCGGPPTVLSPGATVPASYPRKFTVQIRIWPGSNRNTRCGTVESLWAASGPYTLTAPVFASSLTVLCGPAQGPLGRAASNGTRTYTLSFVEVL